MGEPIVFEFDSWDERSARRCGDCPKRNKQVKSITLSLRHLDSEQGALRWTLVILRLDYDACHKGFILEHLDSWHKREAR
jgi:hypothetical protein